VTNSERCFAPLGAGSNRQYQLPRRDEREGGGRPGIAASHLPRWSPDPVCSPVHELQGAGNPGTREAPGAPRQLQGGRSAGALGPLLVRERTSARDQHGRAPDTAPTWRSAAGPLRSYPECAICALLLPHSEQDPKRGSGSAIHCERRTDCPFWCGPAYAPRRLRTFPSSRTDRQLWVTWDRPLDPFSFARRSVRTQESITGTSNWARCSGPQCSVHRPRALC
jgi:hypothetical protein